MLEKIIAVLATWIMGVISSMSYGGIVLLMGIESACIPLPSEIIMPFAGFLVFKDRKSTRLNSSHTDISRMPSSA